MLQNLTSSSHLALNECADATLGVSDNFYVLDLGMFRKMFHEHSAKVSLVDVGWQTAKTSFTPLNRSSRKTNLPTKTLAS